MMLRNVSRNRVTLCLLMLVISKFTAAAAEDGRLMINERRWHLGQPGAAEWEEFSEQPPDAPRLDVTFTARVPDREMTLFIRQDDVRQDWLVELNGRRLGKLFLMEADLISSLVVPRGVLRDGENDLAIIPPKLGDDIVLNQIWLQAGDVHDAIGEAGLEVTVHDADFRVPLPARITIIDQHGTLVPLTALKSPSKQPPAAIRPGVAYMGTQGTSLGLPAGSYTVFASRGFEYSVGTQQVHVVKGESRTLDFTIRREVPTSGLISCDPHVHTLTHSGHGDATVDERMLTLAGEGLELPIATDHNYHTDFQEAAGRMGVAGFFTPVTGNEVTTGTAHFNIFPTRPDARVVDFRIASWPALMAAMRATPDVKVVVLNHPRNVHNGFQPFAATNFNNVSGEHLRGPEFTFDAMELLSSSAQQTDFMSVYHGWFALLNYGYRITGLGSSDGHDVSRYIIGQSRTYITAPDDDVSRIKVATACSNLLAGRALVSLGLLVDLKVDGKFGVGDLATGLGEEVEVNARVLGPAWVTATNVALFANGAKLFETIIRESAGQPGEKASVTWKFPRPRHDVNLVAIATGPGITAPYWAIPRPYQPTSKRWAGRIIGSTNPVWLDADRDGRFTAARSYARQLIERHGTDPAKLIPALAAFDEAVAAQAASLCQAAGKSPASGAFSSVLADASVSVRRGFNAYAESLAGLR